MKKYHNLAIWFWGLTFTSIITYIQSNLPWESNVTVAPPPPPMLWGMWAGDDGYQAFALKLLLIAHIRLPLQSHFIQGHAAMCMCHYLYYIVFLRDKRHIMACAPAPTYNHACVDMCRPLLSHEMLAFSHLLTITVMFVLSYTCTHTHLYHGTCLGWF